MSVIAGTTIPKPSPLWGGLGGGASSAPADGARQEISSTADAAGPPPASPTEGEEKKGFKRLDLALNAIGRARTLRRNMTDAERTLWRALREAFPEQHWRKQVPLGPYFADFCSHSAKLVIEVDGGQHDRDRDAARTRFLEGEGYRVLRFWNNDVLANIEGVTTSIADALPVVGSVGRGPEKAS